MSCAWGSPSAGDKTAVLGYGQHEVGINEDLRTLLRLLPEKQLCDGLYDGFMTGVHPVMPLIHVPTFTQQYTSFWGRHSQCGFALQEGSLKKVLAFLPLLFGIL